MKFVDVILPLPLEGCFTYSLHPDMRHGDLFGRRVLVPFGKSLTYTAMVVRQHDDEPTFAYREVLSLLDDQPMLLPQQYKLWQWIADYYMSPLGEIYKAALPSGLKAEDGFKPRMETYVGLGEDYRSAEGIARAMDQLSRAGKQLAAFVEYLHLSGWDTMTADGATEEIVPVTREELMNVSRASAPVVNALCTRGVLYIYKVEVGRLGLDDSPNSEHLRPLSEPQADAFNRVKLQFLSKPVVLLHGVTSSGKTELYMHLIQQTIDRGGQVLYLLPEIALTVQIMQRLRRVFGNRLGIYHSRYSDAERVEVWRKQMGHAPFDVILGARSAVFLPFRRLELVIVDEEHETSFKQQDPAPRYHARSAAIMLARMYGAKTLLGTATPSLESWHNATQGKYGLVTLATRFKGVQLPDIEVVDIKDLRHRKMMSGPFSPQLLAAIRQALADNMQVILFQNRRGFSQMVECKACGWVPHCVNCDVSLTLHKSLGMLTCHYCGYTYGIPTECPSCECRDLRGRGYGTEKIEDELLAVFPEARVARMDLDTTRTRNAYDRIIADFASGKTNVLIGTQMVSKGLDFDRVAVVGILDADTMLNMPDFRAHEHAFMMMSQVAGRAGRRGSRGKVFLQTRNPQLPVIQQVVTNDCSSFFSQQMEERQAFRYPPFYHVIYVNLRHTKEPVVETAATLLASRLRLLFGTRVLGPDKPTVARVKQQNIRKIVIKLERGIDLARVRSCLRQEQKQLLADKQYATLQVYYDVDPL